VSHLLQVLLVVLGGTGVLMVGTLNAWWRAGGSLEAGRRTKHDWGDMQRRGLGRT